MARSKKPNNVVSLSDVHVATLVELLTAKANAEQGMTLALAMLTPKGKEGWNAAFDAEAKELKFTEKADGVRE